MQIAFRKISNQPKHFVFEQEGMRLEGEVFRKFHKIYVLDALLSGSLLLICNQSGEEFFKQIEQKLVLYISDGLWDTQSQSKLDSFDVIEFFDGFMDIKSIFQAEIELIKSDYHIKE